MQITLLNTEIQAEIPVTSLTSADMSYVATPICQSSLPAFHSHTNDPILPFFQLYISSIFFNFIFLHITHCYLSHVLVLAQQCTELCT